MDFVRILILLYAINSCLGSLLNYIPDAGEDESSYEWQKRKLAKYKRTILSSCECGPYPPGDKEKIFAWNALVEFTFDRKNKQYCSGTLINSKLVLTGYDCLLKESSRGGDPKVWPPRRHVDPSDVDVWLEPDAAEAHPHTQPGLKVAEIFYDLDFISAYSSSGDFEKNIALVMLEKEIDFSKSKIKPICLGSPEVLSHTKRFEVTYWADKEHDKRVKAHTFHNGTFMDLKSCRKETNLRVLDGNFCSPSSEREAYLETSGNAFVAVVSKDGSNDSLLAVQLGVASFNDVGEQEQTLKPGHREFFTSIETVMPFIDYVSSEQKAKWCKEPSMAGVGARMAIYAEPDATTTKAPPTKNVESESMNWEQETFTSDARTMDSSCTCGVKKTSQISGRIVGGTTANPYEYRWHVYYTVKTIDEDNYPSTYTAICGGSIINNRFILTAAHCVVQLALVYRNTYPVEVQTDAINLYIHIHSRKNDKNSRKLGLKRVLYHPGFVEAKKSEGGYFDWDVALLELETPLTFDENVIPICLPYTGEKFELIGLQSLITGFGYTSPTAHPADYLQKISVPIHELSYCSDITPGRVTERFICAGTLDRYKDAAGGDSGGPLSILTNKTNQYVQVGLVSWAQDIDTKSKTAAYYFDVREVLPFIDYFSAKAQATWCPR